MATIVFFRIFKPRWGGGYHRSPWAPRGLGWATRGPVSVDVFRRHKRDQQAAKLLRREFRKYLAMCQAGLPHRRCPSESPPPSNHLDSPPIPLFALQSPRIPVNHPEGACFTPHPACPHPIKCLQPPPPPGGACERFSLSSVKRVGNPYKANTSGATIPKVSAPFQRRHRDSPLEAGLFSMRNPHPCNETALRTSGT